ncbi:MAG: threonine--tRNA ligase [Patescibacteria group bacterium]
MENSIEIKRHSAAHVMAAAIHRLFPKAKFGVGPVIDFGFYYDINIGRPVTPEDVAAIEEEMQRIVREDLEFKREEISIDQAISMFEELGQIYKVELLSDLKEKGTTRLSQEEQSEFDGENSNIASIYRTGSFVDLCRGPHVERASQIGKFKLTKVAGAYWRGNVENPQLQRIYGVSFETKDDLYKHLKMLEEAEKRDHRKLGKELDLFTFSPLVGSGLPLFTPRGTILRRELENFVWSLMNKHGYSRVDIPHMAKSDLYKTSGHWDKFSDDIFHVSSEKTKEEFVLKPMNCPHHTQIFAGRPRSYRDLPIRYSEVTKVYRDENTGQLQGLSRVRSITQDDAHVFCTLEQVRDEAKKLYDIIKNFYAKFEMPLELHLSLSDPNHPEKYLGDKLVWEKSEGTLREILQEIGLEFKEDPGEAAFYGPKIDFIAKDAIGREWQLATIQLDFNMPERFELEYVDADGEKRRPVMLHRAILGSVERFIAILIEHYSGAFPLWLAPEQVRILPVADRHNEFAEGLAAELLEKGIRVEVDTTSESVSKKIRNAEHFKVPAMLVVGDKEASGEALSVRRYGVKEQESLSKDEFIEKTLKQIEERA